MDNHVQLGNSNPQEHIISSLTRS